MFSFVSCEVKESDIIIVKCSFTTPLFFPLVGKVDYPYTVLNNCHSPAPASILFSYKTSICIIEL